MIHREVCEKGFDKKLNSFVQSYGSKELDASCLRIGLVGFLPTDDPRIVGTVEAIERAADEGRIRCCGTTRRSRGWFAAGEGAFLACSFWLVTSLWLIGRRADARKMFDRLLTLRNDVGLLSEEYDRDSEANGGKLSTGAVAYRAYSCGVCDIWIVEAGIGGGQGRKA